MTTVTWQMMYRYCLAGFTRHANVIESFNRAWPGFFVAVARVFWTLWHWFFRTGFFQACLFKSGLLRLSMFFGSGISQVEQRHQDFH